MNDFISREKAKEIYLNSLKRNSHIKTGASEIHDQEHLHILHLLDKVSSENVVYVVLCKNCIHRGIPIECPMCYEELVDVWNDDEHDVDFIKRDFSTDNGFCDNGEDKNGRCLY